MSQKITSLEHVFVDYFPPLTEMNDGILYISMTGSMISHKCCCGCGREVVLRISPIDWTFAYDGKTVSLSPSIGNWNFECKSHYWIINSKVVWAANWSKKKIDRCRAEEAHAIDLYYNENVDKSQNSTNTVEKVKTIISKKKTKKKKRD